MGFASLPMAALAALTLAVAVPAAPPGVVCKDGVCTLAPEAMERLVAPEPSSSSSASSAAAGDRPVRMLQGCVSAGEMLDFLAGSGEPPPPAAPRSLGLVLLAAFFGGMLLNLTPCVLPLVPVNLIVIGRGWRRGLAYGSGMALAYGALGVFSAFGGLAFGSVQSHPAFMAAVALVFAYLALGMADLAPVPFFGAALAGRRPRGGSDVRRGLFGVFLLGAVAALMAGACVAPVALAVCTEAAARTAAGEWPAAALPLALGLGMGAPYPLLAGGIRVLPRPGRWMRHLRLAFAAVLALVAAHYARSALRPLFARPAAPAASGADASGADAKPRLFKIGAPWCASCRAMDATVFRDARVTAALAAFAVERVEIDGFGDLRRHPLLAPLADRIRGVPCYVIVPCDLSRIPSGSDSR